MCILALTFGRLEQLTPAAEGGVETLERHIGYLLREQRGPWVPWGSLVGQLALEHREDLRPARRRTLCDVRLAESFGQFGRERQPRPSQLDQLRD
jgi:hypothetical protein